MRVQLDFHRWMLKLDFCIASNVAHDDIKPRLTWRAESMLLLAEGYGGQHGVCPWTDAKKNCLYRDLTVRLFARGNDGPAISHASALGRVTDLHSSVGQKTQLQIIITCLLDA